jgi:hypothetical protein
LIAAQGYREKCSPPGGFNSRETGLSLLRDRFCGPALRHTLGIHTGEWPLIEIGCTPATPPSGTGCIYFVIAVSYNHNIFGIILWRGRYKSADVRGCRRSVHEPHFSFPFMKFILQYARRAGSEVLRAEEKTDAAEDRVEGTLTPLAQRTADHRKMEIIKNLLINDVVVNVIKSGYNTTLKEVNFLPHGQRNYPIFH